MRRSSDCSAIEKSSPNWTGPLTTRPCCRSTFLAQTKHVRPEKVWLAGSYLRGLLAESAKQSESHTSQMLDLVYRANIPYGSLSVA